MRIITLLILLFILSGCVSTPPATSTIEQRRSELENVINTGINGEKAKVFIQGNTVRAQINNSILFGFDKHQVNTQFIPTIQRLSAYLKSHPSMNLVIEGHTDKVGKPEYNKTLSLKRANAVKAAFASLGVKENRIRAIGQGESKPITGASNKENRRVEIIFQDQMRSMGSTGETTASGSSVSSLSGKANHVDTKNLPFVVQAGFNPDKLPYVRESEEANFSLSLFISPSKTVNTAYFPLLAEGKSKDKKSHTVKMEVKVSVPVSTKRYGCIVGTCLADEHRTKTDTDTITLHIPASGMGEETGLASIRLGSKLTGMAGFFAGGVKDISAGGAKVSYRVISWK